MSDSRVNSTSSKQRIVTPQTTFGETAKYFDFDKWPSPVPTGVEMALAHIIEQMDEIKEMICPIGRFITGNRALVEYKQIIAREKKNGKKH